MSTRGARAFDEALAGHGRTEFADLARTARRIGAEAAAVAPSAEFASTVRAHLMAEAALSRPRTPVVRPARRALPVVTKVSIAGFAAAGTMGMVTASAQALPGDPLYPVKRSVESALVAMQPSDVGRSSVQLASASRRLTEAAALAHQNTAASNAAVAESLADFVHDGSAAATLLLAKTADPALASELSDFLASSSVSLAALKPELPATAYDEYAAALSLMDELSARLTGGSLHVGDAVGTPATRTADSSAVVDRLQATGGADPAPTSVPGISPTAPSVGLESDLISGVGGVVPNLLGGLLD